MDIKLSNYLTTPQYRRNSGTLYDDLVSMKTTREVPTWWKGFKPQATGFWGVVAAPITYPSYWAARYIGKLQTAGVEAHKTSLGLSPSKRVTNDEIRRISAYRMMNRIHNARTYLGNEAMYKHK